MCRSQAGTDRRPSVDIVVSPLSYPRTKYPVPGTRRLSWYLVRGTWFLLHVDQAALNDFPDHRRGHRAAVVRAPLGFVEHDGDAELRILRGREPDEGRDVFLVRVLLGLRIDLLRRARLARDPDAGDGGLLAGALVDDPFQDLAHLLRGL